jgi:NitT/TauT family transport system ATP-binding protein
MIFSPAVSLAGASRQFGDYVAIQGLDLMVPAGHFVSLVGPSGCGKSTLLNLIAGLLEPTSGTVSIFEQPLKGINRRAGYMFQQDALLPWKTVEANIALGLEFRGVPASGIRLKVDEWIGRVGLKGFEKSFPHQLSGGMRKRAALAQTWIADPDIILMDEPFSALDVHTRLRMESEVLALWGGSNKTIIFVTHDLEEAIALSDEVLLLSAGPASRIVGSYPVGLPRPRNLIDLKTESAFLEVYRRIWSQLREEVIRSRARY